MYGVFTFKNIKSYSMVVGFFKTVNGNKKKTNFKHRDSLAYYRLDEI